MEWRDSNDNSTYNKEIRGFILDKEGKSIHIFSVVEIPLKNIEGGETIEYSYHQVSSYIPSKIQTYFNNKTLEEVKELCEKELKNFYKTLCYSQQ